MMKNGQKNGRKNIILTKNGGGLACSKKNQLIGLCDIYLG
jgi:hypothetical protein